MLQRISRLTSPHTRGQIVQALAVRKSWRGKRDGIDLKFKLSDQARLDCARIEWQAKIAGVWKQGKNGTVWDCILEIEEEYTRATPNSRDRH